MPSGLTGTGYAVGSSGGNISLDQKIHSVLGIRPGLPLIIVLALLYMYCSGSSTQPARTGLS